MERKLATVLFVDIVDSTRLVTGMDPEVVRRRVNRFFETVSHCVDRRTAASSRSSPATRCSRRSACRRLTRTTRCAPPARALAMRTSVDELGLEARIGIEAGEVVVEDAESTFATGEAVNLAARLQQAARPGEILVGPTAYRLAGGEPRRRGRRAARAQGHERRRSARGASSDALDGPGTAARAARAARRPRQRARAAREHLRAHDARPPRAPLHDLRRARRRQEPARARVRRRRRAGERPHRAARCPYGEGVTYWPLAEMVKAAAGISDDDPLEEAFEKLRECCAEEAIADVLGLAAGMMEALEGERSPQEIAWAAREVMESIADVQPLILLFEDIHWAEEPLLDLIEHLADWVRAPLLILCLARPELLETRARAGAAAACGRPRSSSSRCPRRRARCSSRSCSSSSPARRASRPLPCRRRSSSGPRATRSSSRRRSACSSRAAATDADRIPDTLQALIAARIDHLPPDGKTLLQRASVIGRVFWKGALEHLSPDVEDLDALARRPAPARVPAPRAPLVDLRRARLPLQARPDPRGRVHGACEARPRAAPRPLRGVARRADRGGARRDPRVPPRPGRRVPRPSSRARRPRSSREEAGVALVKAAKRAIAREAYATARTLGLRAVELRPTLGARYVAARAAWRLQDWAAVQVEMEKVREQARDAERARRRGARAHRARARRR